MRVEGLSFNKGRCFVEFSTREEALAAQLAVNGIVPFKGKLLLVQCGVAGATEVIV